MTRNDLVYIGQDMFPWWVNRYHAPTTEDIRMNMRRDDRYVIQLIGGQFNVLDLNTLRNMGLRGVYTIGPPVLVTEDFDAAIMFCTMRLAYD